MSTAHPVLAVSSHGDPALDLVADALQERGSRLVVFDTAGFPSSSDLSFHLDDSSHDTVLGTDHGNVAFSELSGVWLRRIAVARDFPDTMRTEHQAPARREIRTTLTGILAAYDGPIVDRLALINAAADKPEQLRRARGLGLAVPRTLITNDPAAARGFARSCADDVMAKPLGPITVDGGETGELGMFASAVTSEDLDHLDGLRLCPIVGTEVFAAAVDSQATTRGRDDWRRGIDELAEAWTPYDLPAEVTDRLTALARSYGLTYSAADLILTPKGRHVFLESNPAGEWVWLEETLNLGIARALAGRLAA